jgi:hypothetical protein
MIASAIPNRATLPRVLNGDNRLGFKNSKAELGEIKKYLIVKNRGCNSSSIKAIDPIL